MSRYGHIVKFNGKYYKAGEEVPDNKQYPKFPDAPQQKEAQEPAKHEEKKTPPSSGSALQTGQPKKAEQATAKPQTTK